MHLYVSETQSVFCMCVRSYTMFVRLRVISGSSGKTGWRGSLDDTQPRVLLRARPSFVAGDFCTRTETQKYLVGDYIVLSAAI